MRWRWQDERGSAIGTAVVVVFAIAALVLTLTTYERLAMPVQFEEAAHRAARLAALDGGLSARARQELDDYAARLSGVTVTASGPAPGQPSGTDLALEIVWTVTRSGVTPVAPLGLAATETTWTYTVRPVVRSEYVGGGP